MDGSNSMAKYIYIYIYQKNGMGPRGYDFRGNFVDFSRSRIRLADFLSKWANPRFNPYKSTSNLIGVYRLIEVR